MEMVVAKTFLRGSIAASARPQRTRILWVSRHEPKSGQWKALRLAFGKVDLTRDARPFDSAADIVERFRRGEYDDMIVVAPLDVLNALVEAGFEPIRAVEKDGEYALERFLGAEIKSRPL